MGLLSSNPGILKPGCYPISSEVLGGAAANFTSVTIPAGYRALGIFIDFEPVATGDILVQFNGDAGANYDYQFIKAVAGVVTGGNASYTGCYSGSTILNKPHNGILYVNNGAVLKKVYQFVVGQTSSYHACTGMWNNTAEITAVYVVYNGGNLKAGSRLTIVGYK